MVMMPSGQLDPPLPADRGPRRSQCDATVRRTLVSVGASRCNCP